MTTDVDLSEGYYPRAACETVRDELNLYEGYFANYPPGTPRYAFVPEPGWEVTHWESAGLGTHGCCSNCVVTLVRVEKIIKVYLPPIVDPSPIEPFLSGMNLVIIAVIVAWMLTMG